MIASILSTLGIIGICIGVVALIRWADIFAGAILRGRHARTRHRNFGRKRDPRNPGL